MAGRACETVRSWCIGRRRITQRRGHDMPPHLGSATSRVCALLVLVAVSAAVSLLGARPALAVRLSRADRTAAYSYLRAVLAYERAVAPNAPTPAAAIRALARSVEVGCPAVLTGAPLPEQGAPTSKAAADASETLEEEAEELQQELALGFGDASIRAAAGAVAAFISAVESIHWTNRRYTVAFRSVTQALAAERPLAAPQVCADARAWASSDYRALPRSADELYEATKHAMPPPSQRRLFEATLGSLSGKRAHALFGALGGLITASELRGAEASGSVMRKLGLPSLLVTPPKQLASADLVLERMNLILVGLGAPICTTPHPLVSERDLGVCRNPVESPQRKTAQLVPIGGTHGAQGHRAR